MERLAWFKTIEGNLTMSLVILSIIALSLALTRTLQNAPQPLYDNPLVGNQSHAGAVREFKVQPELPPQAIPPATTSSSNTSTSTQNETLSQSQASTLSTKKSPAKSKSQSNHSDNCTSVLGWCLL